LRIVPTKSPLRALIIGTLAGAEGGARAGGTAILLGALIAELRQRPEVTLRVLDLSAPAARPRPWTALLRVFAFIVGMARRLPDVDVVTLHTVTTKLWFTGGMALVLARLAGRPLLIRKFAGTDYNDFRWMKRTSTRWILAHCDTYLAETKHLVKVAHERDSIAHCRWFPTHRPLDSPSPQPGRPRCERFVFIGQVREYKGLRELVAAAEHQDQAATVDVYGPLFADLPADLFADRRRITYRGVLHSQDVVPTLRQYDALIVPTKATTEGYPGAILEAYAAGIPVIATSCGAIPEIVDDTCGILIAPGDAEALRQAMQTLCRDPALYLRLCQGARERAQEFSAAHWAAEFLHYCNEIAGKSRARRTEH